MRLPKILSVILLALGGACALCGSDTLSVPVSGFSWKLKSEKKNALTVKTSVLENVPCLEIQMPYQNRNTVILTHEFEKEIDLRKEWNEITALLQCSDKINADKIVSVELRTSEGAAVPYNVTGFDPVTGLCRFRWDPMHELIWNRIADLSKCKSITFYLKTDAWTDKQKSVTVKLSDLTLTKNNHWAQKYPEREKAWLEWLDYLSRFKPDYSDGSKYLLPPETGRIKTPLALVKDGKANAELIITKDKYGVAEHAAKDFRDQVKMISGAELPVLEAPGTMPVKIFVNSPDSLKKYPEDAAYLKDLKPHYGEDGFFIRTEGNNIHIGSIVPVGARNGLYRLLENNTDIIWARQDETFGTVYTETKNINIIWADARFKPMTPFRGWLGARPHWSARNGANSNMPTIWGGQGKILGNFSDWLPNKPPYQVYVDGKYVPFGYYQSQVCIGQPDSYDLIMENMCKSIERRKKLGEKMVSINWVTEDNWLVCTCEACTAPITLPDGTVLESSGQSQKHSMAKEEQRFRSNQFYMFANRLARGLKEKYPEIKLQLLAYFFMEPPPDIPLEDNIIVMLAPLYTRADFRNPMSAPTNDHLWHIRDGWKKKGVELALYEYYFQHPAAEMMKYDIQDYLNAGFSNIGSELPGEFGRADSWHHWDLAAVEYWCFTRLAVDYTQDVEQLRKYFLTRVYREGAPAVEKFYALIRSQYYAGIRGQKDSKYDGLVPAYIFEKGHGESLQKELRAALPGIRNPIARLNYGRFLGEYEKMYDAWLIKTGKKKAPEDKEALAKKASDPVRNTIMFRWEKNPEISHMLTSVEYKGRFPDALRFRFTPQKDGKGGKFIIAYAYFLSKKMGYSAKNPLPGKVVFKIRAATPGIHKNKMPFFGAFQAGGMEFSQQKDCRRLAGDVYEISFLPSGTTLNADDIYGFMLEYPRAWIDPAKGYAEFEIFDIEVKLAEAEPEKDATPADMLGDFLDE